MRTWVKLYVEIIDDPKLAAMPDPLFRTLVNLFAVAGRVDKNGQLGTSLDLSYWLRKSIEVVEPEMQYLAKCNVCVTKNGVWRLKNWQKFNKIAASDRAKAIRERVKKSRENKQKNAQAENISNADVTRYIDVSNTPRIDKNRGEEIIKTLPAAKPPRHPSLIAYQEASKTNPDRSQNEAIISAVGDIPGDVERWKHTVSAYCLNGWNKRNVANMLDYYKRHELPSPGKNGHSEKSAGEQLRAMNYTDSDGNPV